MDKPKLVPVGKREIQVGAPTPFPVFDANHTLLLCAGQFIQNDLQIESLQQIDLYRPVCWDSQLDSASSLYSASRPLPQDFAGLRLLPGTSLYLRPAGQKTGGYVLTKLVGWLAGEDIVATRPDRSALDLPPGTELEIKLLAGQCVVDLRTSLRAKDAPPQPYLHLDYPPSIAARRLRKSLRANVEIGARLGDAHHPTRYDGTIANLSASGGLLESPRFIAETGDRMQLSLSLPGMNQEHALTLQAIVRNLHCDDGNIPTVQYGLEFLDITTAEQLILEHFVFQTLLEY